MKKLLWAVILLVSALGLASETENTTQEAKSLEPVQIKSVTLAGDFVPGPRPARIGYTVVKAQVNSNGCTDSENFRVRVKDQGGVKQIALVRIKPDHCRAFFPEGTEVELKTEFLGWNAKVLVANPIRVEESHNPLRRPPAP